MTPQLKDIKYDIAINLINCEHINLRLIINWLHMYRRDIPSFIVEWPESDEIEFKQEADYTIALAECAYKKVLGQIYK